MGPFPYAIVLSIAGPWPGTIPGFLVRSDGKIPLHKPFFPMVSMDPGRIIRRISIVLCFVVTRLEPLAHLPSSSLTVPPLIFPLRHGIAPSLNRPGPWIAIPLARAESLWERVLVITIPSTLQLFKLPPVTSLERGLLPEGRTVVWIALGASTPVSDPQLQVGWFLHRL